jgi:hypothetical protein
MDYKRIIKSQRLRFRILNALRWVPDSVMLRLQYRIKMGFWPDFKHPKRFTEKLQLYKMKYRNPVMSQCVDKYEVRKFVEKKGLGNTLTTLYGVYDKPSDIDFGMLPDKFIMKTTDGGGGLNVIIVDDKSKADYDDIMQKLSLWNGRKKSGVSAGREWAYTGIKQSRIVVEELLEDERNADGSIEDYKMMCFNGTFRSLWIDKNRYSDHHRGFWDANLHFLPNVTSDHDTFTTPPVLPGNMNEMVKIAEKLSEDFPYARIDLYNIKGRIYFGEITFYPWSGYVKFHPDEFDYQLGDFFTFYQ